VTALALRVVIVLTALGALTAVVSTSEWLQRRLDEYYMWMHISLLINIDERVSAVILGLLSSSCCALQLFINAFSLGCAGFNTFLGPHRATFMAIALSTQAWQWWIARTRFDMLRHALISTSITLPLMFLPEALYAYSICCRKRASKSIGEDRKLGRGNRKGQRNSHKQKVTLTVDGMGCIACVTAVKNALLKDGDEDSVGNIEISFETGKISYILSALPSSSVEEIAKEHASAAANRLTDVGFEAKVANVFQVKNGLDDDVHNNKNNPDMATDSSLSSSSSISSSMSMRELAVYISAGLLSSSCCALQLGLNVLAAFNVIHVGCAGFNKILGPLRPVIRTITLAYLGGLWNKSFRARTEKRKLLIGTLFTLVLMFLPEALNFDAFKTHSSALGTQGSRISPL